MFRKLLSLFGRKEPAQAGAPPTEAPPPPLRELGELPHVDPDAIAESPEPEAAYEIVGALRAQKLAGLRERADRLAQEQRLATDAAEKAEAQQHERRSQELARDGLLARRAFNTLPNLIRQAAARGLDAAILADGFVDEGSGSDGNAHVVALNGRTCCLRGWLIPFHALCEEAGVPLTIISERVEMDAGGKEHRVFHVLAVDLARL